MIQHPIPPVWDTQSHTLILGSFPSVRSRESGFFYGHPQNRFWRVLAAVYDVPLPVTTEEKIALLHRQHLALWDVIASCEITGSADSTILAAVPNDLTAILAGAPIRRIITNGKTADALYRRHLLPVTGREALSLPSTSPANARADLAMLTESWRILRAPCP